MRKVVAKMIFIILTCGFISTLVPEGLVVQAAKKETIVAQVEPFLIDNSTSKHPQITYQGSTFYPLSEFLTIYNGKLYIENSKASFTLPLQLNNGINSTPYIDPTKIRPIAKQIDFKETVQAEAAIIIENRPENIFFSKNSNEKLYPASTTKIMTALLALELGNISDTVIVSEEIESIPFDSSKAHIRPGDVLTLEQLLYGLMVPSGNDAAVAVACHIAGSEKNFVKMMNEKAMEIGAVNTQFVNSHGYHDPDQYTTAEDLAKIGLYAAQYKDFLPLVSTPTYRANFHREDGEVVVRNWRATNQQIRKQSPYYDETIIGGKTGYTSASKHTLVSFAKENGYDYVTVILQGHPYERYVDTSKLFERAITERTIYNETNKQRITIENLNSTLTFGNKVLANYEHIFMYKNQLYVNENVLHRFLDEVNTINKIRYNLILPMLKDNLYLHNGKFPLQFRSIHGIYNHRLDFFQQKEKDILSTALSR
ncbi:hypothetical protein BKP37_09930 [Anaerobacillus alkalilacustris]|uniref:Peptidase S11 D-alanyl-D-alanine carboxypeptidase A N-terminal domain-containing protein n=1 Tax=Anaerobacillus alkalilacustris TaxID=393763 RepID=A0A1S2LNB2_9BACI|nr:D-alanyl-D-alanine carboxypeptidase family protein [Anaerobacillus alkalilacustris]OIJ13593.1 hypothetical protein BKP37_09930 [Anaerobacillus alkalilacustris]